MIIAAGLSATDNGLGEERAAQAKQEVLSRRGDLGLDENHDFRIRKARIDERGAVHTKMQQTFRGVPIWGGKIITHTDVKGPRQPDK